jgi:Domain of unknown function (DUF1905)
MSNHKSKTKFVNVIIKINTRYELEILMKNTYHFTSTVWMYSGVNPWYFATVDEHTSKQIKSDLLFKPKGFGSIPVVAKIGNTSWKTSIFPEKNKNYLLPIKKEIRQKENITENIFYNITLTTMA